MFRTFLATFLIALAAGASSIALAEPVLIEAEAFTDRGGWVVDQQFMDQMGSPFLLAHGLGIPVQDATTAATLPAAGDYRLWVRTRDWVGQWKAQGAPGKFRVMIEGREAGPVYGTEGAAWHWQDGGIIHIAQANPKIALHDLTGFEGRCDALLLCADAGYRPPDDGEELAVLRRKWRGLPEKPEDGGEYDLVVAGGGMAGTCASVAAARLGLRVALVQDRPVLGGNNSSEVRVWLQGARNLKPFPRVGDVVAELEQAKHAHYGPTNTAELYEDEKKVQLVKEESNIKLLLDHRLTGAEVSDKRIGAVIVTDVISGRRLRLRARWFADCTGDACLGALAGADLDMTVPGHMGACNLWNVSDTGAAQSFPRCPWALDLTSKPFPGRAKDKPDPLKLGGWYWESGFDHDPFDKAEYIRDWNFRAMYGAWDALKNVDQVFPNHKLNWAAYVAGKRESRRLLGDVIITKKDLEQMTDFPDGFVPTGWKIDLHLADRKYDKGFEGDGFISEATFGPYKMPFWIPYRALYSRNIGNLFMAGRDISVTHDALGAVRVMRTGGMMGEIVGMATSVCKKNDADPRGVYDRYLEQLRTLVEKGVGKFQTPPEALEHTIDGAARPKAAAGAIKLDPPAWLTPQRANLGRAATVTVSGSKDPAHGPALLNDGKIELADPNGRWVSEAALPHYVEFAWNAPQSIGAMRIVSGYPSGGQIIAPVTDLTIQRQVEGKWEDVPGGKVRANERFDLALRFAAVTASRVRLVMAGAKDGLSRVWEIEWYGAIAE